MIKYKINWVSKVTGKSGEGKPIFDSLNMAQETADRLNRESKNTMYLPYKDVLHHWVEGVEVVADEEAQA